MNKRLSFAIDNYNILEDDPTMTLLELYIVSEGDNRHDTYFTVESIEDAAPSIKNKPLICIWNKMMGDFKEHARTEYDLEQQDSVGCIPESNKANIAEYKGKKFFKTLAVVWKHYYPHIAEKLKSNQDTKISMEIEILESHEENGLLYIDKFRFLAVTLLGLKYTEAIPDATAKLIKFSTNDYKDMVKETNEKLTQFAIPEKVKKNAKKALDLEQKNPQLISFAKKLIEKDKLHYGEITWMFSKINNLRKEDNLLFYGGDEGRKWSKDVIMEFEKEEITDFPTKGDNKKISLSNSEFPQFDYSYAKKIKEEYPSIWDKGGNGGEGENKTDFTGNDAFRIWTRVRDRSSDELTKSDKDWIQRREDFMNRFYGITKNIAGVIAVIKWGGIIEKGTSYMKDLVKEEMKKVDEDKKSKNAYATNVKIGDFVEWDSSGGKAKGKVTKIIKDGEVPNIAVKVTGTEEEPALQIQIYKKDNDGWVSTDTFVGHKMSTVTKIDDLPTPSKKMSKKGEYAMTSNDIYNILAKMLEKHEADEYGYPKYMLQDMDDEYVYAACFEDGIKYMKMPYMKKDELYEVDFGSMKEVYMTTQFIDVKPEEMMADNMGKMYSLLVEKTNKLNEVSNNYSELEVKFSEQKETVDDLMKFKADKVKEELQRDADTLYEKYSKYLSEEEKKQLNDKLFESNEFESFKKEVFAVVLPKIEAVANEAKNNKEDKKENKDNLQFNYSAMMKNNNDKDTSNMSPLEKLRMRKNN